MFAHNGLYGVWRWQHLYASAVHGASSHKFTAYSPGGATLFDLVSDDDMRPMRGAATGWWAAVRYKGRGQSLLSTIALFYVR